MFAWFCVPSVCALCALCVCVCARARVCTLFLMKWRYVEVFLFAWTIFHSLWLCVGVGGGVSVFPSLNVRQLRTLESTAARLVSRAVAYMCSIVLLCGI